MDCLLHCDAQALRAACFRYMRKDFLQDPSRLLETELPTDTAPASLRVAGAEGNAEFSGHAWASRLSSIEEQLQPLLEPEHKVRIRIALIKEVLAGRYASSGGYLGFS